MGINIQTNINLLRFMGSSYKTGLNLATSLKRLSSGIRINSASDDAAGLSLSQQMTMRTNANNIAKNNTQTGIAMLNTADSALSGMVTSLQRMRDLAVQSANGVYSDEERAMLQKEVGQLSEDISQNYNSAKFGSKKLFEGSSFSGIKAIEQLTATQIAASYDANHTITSAADFTSKITDDIGGNFILAADIDLSSLPTDSDSIIGGNFTGQLDGNGYKVSNFHIDTGGAAIDNIGLFSQLSGTIKNLGVENFTVSATSSNWTGGLVGQSVGGTIDNCYSKGQVTGQNRTGLLVGFNNAGNVSNSWSSGSVAGGSGGFSAGGLIGANSNGATTANCYSTASASLGMEGYSVGGLIGSNMNGSTISNCYATGDASIATGGAGSNNAGGLVGYNWNGAIIENSYSTGNASADWNVGGLAGCNATGSSIANSYTTGNVTSYATTQYGGLTGYNDASDSNSYYKNNMSFDAAGGTGIDANVSPPPTSGWDTNLWDLSGGEPRLKTFDAAVTAVSNITNLQVGTDGDTNSQIAVDLGFSLGNIDFDISTQGSAVNAIDLIEETMERINSKRSDLGANVNRLQGAISSQDNRLINYSNANSTIKDSDIAAESAQLVKNQIIQNAASSLFSQAKNLDRDLAMQLLNGM